MDAFEAARLKHAKNKERFERARERASLQVPLPEEETKPALEVAPKAKPKREAIIEVKVTLPDREITVTMQKIDVYENVNKSRLTQSEIKRCVENGFSPLMGRLSDLPRSGQ